MTHEQARNNLIVTLGDVLGWGSVPGVDFGGYALLNPCGSPPGDDSGDFSGGEEAAGIRLFFYVRSDWSASPFEICPGPDRSCMNWFFPYDEPLAAHLDTERTLAKVWLDVDRLDQGEAPFTINHEVGHALGLCDGGIGAPNDSLCGGVDESCGGIMHVYGECPDPSWPNSEDKDSAGQQVFGNWSDYGVTCKTPGCGF